MADTCPYHENRGREISSCITSIANLEGWLEKVEGRVEEHHESEMAAIAKLREDMLIELAKIRQDNADAIQVLRDDINHGKGAVWMLIKLGALAGGLVAFVALIWKMASANARIP